MSQVSQMSQVATINPIVRPTRHTGPMTFCRTSTAYCQNCIREVEHQDLRRVLVQGKPYWLCIECLQPVPDTRAKFKRPT